jgi:hypothetical protein
LADQAGWVVTVSPPGAHAPVVGILIAFIYDTLCVDISVIIIEVWPIRVVVCPCIVI